MNTPHRCAHIWDGEHRNHGARCTWPVCRDATGSCGLQPYKHGLTGRFFLGRDQSSHWYLVPLEHQAEWLTWTEIPENDERSWEPPAFARMIDGPTISFTDPKDI